MIIICELGLPASLLVIFYHCYRLIKFDLQIASIFLNGSCHSLAEETVILSYRIGTSDQWKTLAVYASEGKL